MWMRAGLALFIGVLLAPRPAVAQDVRVAAAADLQVALPELATRFERATSFRVQAIFGSSGNISTQIQNGAPYDVFLSADIEYPRHLVELGLGARDALAAYASGRLVLWSRNDSKVDLKQGLKGLSAGTIRRIAIANPAHAPYGRAAVAALRHEGMYDRVSGRLVLGENISQTAQFAESGNADVGIIALSLALGPSLRAAGRYVEIPAAFHPPIEQAALWLKRARNPTAARQFVEFLQQPASREYLQTMGFEPVAR
jgi:molybdate transport system substrate-binding protein